MPIDEILNTELIHFRAPCWNLEDGIDSCVYHCASRDCCSVRPFQSHSRKNGMGTMLFIWILLVSVYLDFDL